MPQQFKLLVVHNLLVEIIGDAGAVSEDLPHGDVGIEVGEIDIEAVGQRRIEAQLTRRDELTDGDAGEDFAAGRDAKAGVDPVGDLLGTIGKAVALGKDLRVALLHENHTGEWIIRLSGLDRARNFGCVKCHLSAP